MEGCQQNALQRNAYLNQTKEERRGRSGPSQLCFACKSAELLQCACPFAVFLCQAHLTSRIKSTFTPIVSEIHSQHLIDSSPPLALSNMYKLLRKFLSSFFFFKQINTGRSMHSETIENTQFPFGVTLLLFISLSYFIYVFVVQSEPLYTPTPFPATSSRERQKRE